MSAPVIRPDLHPLCPVHFLRMVEDENVAFCRYVCPEPSCVFCWRWDMGYFEVKNAQIDLPSPSLTKRALKHEHGYFYLESVEGSRRVWKCPVQGCPNSVIDES